MTAEDWKRTSTPVTSRAESGQPEMLRVGSRIMDPMTACRTPTTRSLPTRSAVRARLIEYLLLADCRTSSGLSFATADVAKIEEGVGRLGQAI